VIAERYALGRYTIIVQGVPGELLPRFTVFVGGKRLGAQRSRPTTLDCERLEHPPAYVPVKSTYGAFTIAPGKRGRPRKDAPRRDDGTLGPMGSSFDDYVEAAPSDLPSFAGSNSLD